MLNQVADEELGAGERHRRVDQTQGLELATTLPANHAYQELSLEGRREENIPPPPEKKEAIQECYPLSNPYYQNY